MSRYTVTVHALDNNGFDFGLHLYPIFNEDYRPILNQLIIDNYRFKEICYSNPIRWRYALQLRMEMLMRDKYNKLFEAKAIDFNPLYNIDITETFKRKLEGTSSNDTSGDTVTETSGEVSSTNYNNTIGNNSTFQTTSQYPTDEMLVDEMQGSGFIDSGGKVKGTTSDTTNGRDNSESTATDNTEYKTKTNGNNVDVEEYERRTQGSSAGLPFSKAMIQLKQYCDEFSLNQQLVDELRDLFITIHGEEDF